MYKLAILIPAMFLSAVGCNNENLATQTDIYNETSYKTFNNSKYRYQFQYPSNASVRETRLEEFSSLVNDTPEAAYNRLGGEVCIIVQYGKGQVVFSAPANEGLNATCLRTGVGADAKFSTEQARIQGVVVSGDKIIEDFSESIRFTLSDNTNIELSGGGLDQESYQQYLDIKPELIKIIESYQKI